MTDRSHHVCRCAHERSAHEHYRAGSECALCGPDACSRFRRDRHAVAQAAPAAPAAAPQVGTRLSA